MTNPDSGVVQPTEVEGDDEGRTKLQGKESTVRHRWHTCPELHKAMDGVTYIADYTKKEEESQRVSFCTSDKGVTFGNFFLKIFLNFNFLTLKFNSNSIKLMIWKLKEKFHRLIQNFLFL
jgi:hypothetical protein